MKVLAPFLLLTGVVWAIGLQSPEENDPAISYANTLPTSNSSPGSSSEHLSCNQQQNIDSQPENKTAQNAIVKPLK